MRWLRTWLAQWLQPAAVVQPLQETGGDHSPAIQDTKGSVQVIYGTVHNNHAPASHEVLRIPHQLPDRPVAGQLFGRDSELHALTQRLRRGENCAVIGAAGLGKTALAAEALRAAVGEGEAALKSSPFPDGIVLLDLYRLKGGADTIWNALANALIGSDQATLPARQRAEAACRNRHVLVVIEGAEEAHGQGGRPSLQALLEVLDPANRYLVLTRDVGQVSPASAVNLKEALDFNAAGQLFDQITDGDCAASIRAKVLELLQGHPLALTWAASLIKRGDDSPQMLLQDWEKAALPSLADPVQAHHTLQWLFQRSLHGLGPDEQQVLACAGLLAHAEFPLAAISTAINDDNCARAALKRLVQANLLRRSSQREDHWHCTHVLAYQFARQRSDGDAKLNGRLAGWLQGKFEEALTSARRDLLPGMISHIAALFAASDSQPLWPLAEFCLYNGEERISELGRLDLVVQVLDSVACWFERLPKVEAEKSPWQREYSIFLTKRGHVQQEQGDLAAAQRSYEDGLKIIHRLAHIDPQNTERQRDLSVCHSKLGDVLRGQGNLAAAQRSHAEGLGIRQLLTQANPENAQWQRDLSVSHDRLCDIQREQGDLAAAQHSCEASLGIRRQLAQAEPRNVQRQRDLCVSHSKLGDMQLEQDELVPARRNYEEALQIARQLTLIDPENTRWQRDLGICHDRLGDAQRKQGDLPAAQRSHEESLQIARRLAQADPGNTKLQRDLSVSYNNVGDVQRDQGDLPAAQRNYELALGIRVLLTRTDTRNALWQRDLSVGHNKLGDIQRDQGDLLAARRSYEESLIIRRQLAQTDPENAQWQRDLSYSLFLLARMAAQRDENEQALEYATQSLAIDERLAAMAPTSATWNKDVETSRRFVARLRENM